MSEPKLPADIKALARASHGHRRADTRGSESSMANKKSKVVWRVSSVPTGMYRSFERRGWPAADYSNGEPAASIHCADDYVPRNVKTGEHAELEVYVVDHSTKPNWTRRRLKRRCKTLQEAKQLVDKFLEQFPHYAPAVTEQVTSVTLTAPTETV